VSKFLWDPAEEMMNGSLLRIVDPGPLRAPINSFTVRRNKDFELTMETVTAHDAVSTARQHPPGTLRINDDTVHWDNGFGFEVTSKGVQPHAFKTTNDRRRGVHETVETSSLYSVEATVPNPDASAYTSTGSRMLTMRGSTGRTWSNVNGLFPRRARSA
jgi:hypothetical protein